MRGGAAYNATTFVDSAVYVGGRRATPATLGEVRQVCREPGKFAWVALREPTEEEFLSTAGEFGLDKLAVEEDATKPHQGPKFQRYGDCFFVVLNPRATPKTRGGSSAARYTPSCERT